MENPFDICSDDKNEYGISLNDAFERWKKNRENNVISEYQNIQGLEKKGLEKTEEFSIYQYTASFSNWINSSFRNDQKLDTNCKKEFANLLDNALKKLEGFDNEIVYRMDSPYASQKEVIKWFKAKKGNIIQVPNYLSTAKENYDNSHIIWKIKTLSKNSKGKDISDITNNKYEKEVLFERNSCFVIKEIDEVNNIIHLEETDTSQNSIKMIGNYTN
tara:strand:+ start:3420 stop:4070 length:651 start_codon:yes stop_codon:yes gene_type:complete